MDWMYRNFRNNKDIVEENIDDYNVYMKRICDTPCYSKMCRGDLRPLYIFVDKSNPYQKECGVCKYSLMYAPATCVYCGGGFKDGRNIFCSIKCGEDMHRQNHRLFEEFMLNNDTLDRLQAIHNIMNTQEELRENEPYRQNALC